MRRYNITRPLMIIGVALAARYLTTTICLLFGAEEEVAGNIGFAVMVLAALFTFTRLNKAMKKK